MTAWYQGRVPVLIKHQKAMLGIFLGAHRSARRRCSSSRRPDFIPNEDQSLLYVLVTLPIQSSMDQTSAAVQKLEQIMLAMPQVEAATSGIGFGFANNSSNQATIFLQLKPLSERHGRPKLVARDSVRSLPAFPKHRRRQGVARESAGDSRARLDRRLRDRSRGHQQPRACRRSIKSATRFSPTRRRIRRSRRCACRRSSPAPISLPKFDRSKALAFGVSRTAFFNTINGTTGSTSSTSSTTAPARIKCSCRRDAGQRTAPSRSHPHLRSEQRRRVMPVSPVPEVRLRDTTTSRSCGLTSTTRWRSTVRTRPAAAQSARSITMIRSPLREARRRQSALRHELRLERHRAPASSERSADHRGFCDGPALRLPGACRAVRKHDDAVRHHARRAGRAARRDRRHLHPPS